MSIYKPYISKKKAIEEAIKDLSPGVRDLVKEVTEIRSKYELKFKKSISLFSS
jgi:hypothetical protein